MYSPDEKEPSGEASFLYIADGDGAWASKRRVAVYMWKFRRSKPLGGDEKCICLPFVKERNDIDESW